LTVSEKQSIQKIPTTNQEAYDLVQRAIIGLLTGKITLKQGKDLALKAKDLDPNYANAYAFAGSYSLFEGVYNGNKELPEAILDALPFIENALELDQDNAFAHFTMGCINEWGRWDYIKAEKEYMKSLELEPNNIGAYYYAISEFYVKMNRQGNALTFIKKYKESVNTETIIPAFDPATILIKSSVLSGNSQEASNYITSYFGLHEKKPYAWLGEYYIWLGEYDSAKLSLETAVQNKDYFMLIPRFQVNLALAYYKTKDYQKAHMVINQLIKKSDTTSIGSPQYFTGWYYSGIGEVDSAFYWLEKAYQNRSPEMPWLKVDLAFKNLKNDNRYRDLYKRTGHKAYDDYISNLEK
jgi:tetratricopeptide (TPR) repeat protein